MALWGTFVLGRPRRLLQQHIILKLLIVSLLLLLTCFESPSSLRFPLALDHPIVPTVLLRLLRLLISPKASLYLPNNKDPVPPPSPSLYSTRGLKSDAGSNLNTLSVQATRMVPKARRVCS